jgi:transcription-repair coupling factor (superfamily II helicase)
MSASEVEERMSAFYDRKYDVLCRRRSSKAGSISLGEHADRASGRSLRAGQLYQLRGRVGRSKTRAYAYLTTPPTSR